ncbi:MAG: DNA mismatch repair endonuclease MutL [Anaerolineales bacterium]|jgi:DNA mismatch repair protein MutL|nr:DNA mismatch repair endonuclease MutL [Anaerolineales bacterium]
MAIRILSPEIASQIAAGEVVERPASVVKELLENSLDAQASEIKIDILEAGRRRIEIADNGTGIPTQELHLAIERHATSKLTQAADLFQISTLGFRGEALASIGSVSRMTLISRHASDPVGARVEVEGGHVSEVSAVGVPTGTVVKVQDLFYNVPARLKFLKHATTERHQIDQLVTRYALAYPQVRFNLQQEGRSALQTSGNGDRREVLAALYGTEVARQMLEVISEDEQIKITGFISPTSLTRSNRREIHFFVNGRPIQDSTLIAATLKAYHTLLMVGRYPQAILFLEIDPASVDVNVHPAKAEVRFREAERIFSAVQRAVRRALLAHTPVPGVGEQLRWSPLGTERPRGGGAPFEAERTGNRWQTPEWPNPTTPGVDAGIPNSGGFDRSLSQPVSTSNQIRLESGRTPILRLIGQVANTYLVAEGPDGLYLIDQHAAHERVLFERYQSTAGQAFPAQSLLQPALVELSPASARLVQTELPMLEHLGYQVEHFGLNTFLVRAVPNILSSSDPAMALRVLVEDFEEDETPLQAEAEARLVARICKRAAVKAGQTLTPDEQRSLLDGLEACSSPRTCPHGRPTMIHLSVDLLEKQFGRRGAR